MSDKLTNALNDFEDNLLDAMMNNAMLLIAKDISFIFKRSVDDFYASYTPKYYKHRTGSLYKIYNIEPTDDGIFISADIDEMGETHRVDDEYIFDIVYMQGYHGGANDGDDHPEPGTPYWRTPPPRKGIKPYTKWGRPAVQSKSIDEMVEERLEEYKTKEGNDLGLSAYSTIKRVFKSILFRRR